jgi:hypothetical protein
MLDIVCGERVVSGWVGGRIGGSVGGGGGEGKDLLVRYAGRIRLRRGGLLARARRAWRRAEGGGPLGCFTPVGTDDRGEVVLF